MTTWITGVLAAGLLAAGLAACGDDDGDGNGGGGTSGGAEVEPVDGQRKGGTLKVISNEGFQHLDPGSSYFQLDYMPVYAVHRPLYSFKPDDARTPVPDLASGEPEVGAGGRTVTVRLRSGVRYSPGSVNREVTSADVKYAIERAFAPAVANGYAPTYFASIDGADKAKGGPIRGIQTPDDRTIVFRLTESFGSTLAQALTLPASAPVPKEYAARFDASTPSKYESDPTVQAFTGPYVIESYRAGRSLKLARNLNWNAESDYRPAYVDRVDWTIGADPNVAGRQILRGRDMVNGDTLAAPILKLGVQRHNDQISFTPLGNRYVTLNTALEPFDDANVRKAVGAAIDRTALQRTRGGRAAGDIATHFLAPNAPGFDAAGGEEGPDGAGWLAKHEGDRELAAEYLRKAGFESGRYNGPSILMVGATGAPADKTAQVVLNAVRSLGFDVNFRSVPEEVMLSRFCGVPKSRTHICPNLGWLPDFPDGYTWLFPTFNSQAIAPVNNTNPSQLRDRRVDAAMAQGTAESDPERRAERWGEVDAMVTETAAAIPWFWDRVANIQSSNVQGVIAQWNAAYDLSFTSLK